MPHSRPMRDIGRHCHELRIPAGNTTWRVIYRIDPDAIVIAEVFAKKSQETPEHAIDIARRRLMRYDAEG